MPIILNNYQWRQTAEDIIIQITLRGVSENNADIFTSQRYIKVTYNQYFFEAILLHSINVQNSQCKITDADIIFELKKNENVMWETLEPNISKKEKLKIKKQLLEEEYLRVQEVEKLNANKKSELKRVAVREQIILDTKERQEIENNKIQEKTKALGNINEWSSKIIPRTGTTKKYKTSTNQQILCSPPKVKEIPEIPLPRSMKTLEVEFTPREFPTPCRESKLDEENEWLKKQAEARRSAGFISEDIRPEEKNPQFLKAKGDEFLKNKNYLGAISAYSFGIKIAPKFVDLYISRSEAHLLVGNFNKTIQDCSTSLDLLKPEVALNLKERALCIGRRGEALCKFGFVKQGVEELKISLKLMASDYFTNVLKKIDNNF